MIIKDSRHDALPDDPGLYQLGYCCLAHSQLQVNTYTYKSPFDNPQETINEVQNMSKQPTERNVARNRTISMRVTPYMVNKLKKLADKHCRTMSRQIEFYIQEGVARDETIPGLGMSAREIALHDIEAPIMKAQAKRDPHRKLCKVR